MEARRSSSSWPWKRKSYQTPKFHVVPNTPQKQQTAEERLLRLSSEGTVEEYKPNYERRTQSISDALLHKNLVQQHAKIAEEAVSGWQKAESEVAKYKKAIEEKGDMEREMRMVREEHERGVKEWEGKVAAVEAEKMVIVRERDATIAEITEAKNKAESQLRSFYIKISSLLKENSRLKYELHLLNKEQQIRTDEKEYTRMAAQTSHKKQLSKSTTLVESHLQVLRSENLSDDADEISCAQSWASAMIAELDHFRKDKALLHADPIKSNMGMADWLTEVESIASSSQLMDDRRSLKQEIELIHASGRMDNTTVASKFCISVTETVKLVRALAHPLLYTSSKKSDKAFSHCKVPHKLSELSESDLQLHIDKLMAIKDKAVELRNSSVSWVVVEFLEELVGVLNRLVKIALYRNAQRDGCSDDDDTMSDMSGLASVSQQIHFPKHTEISHFKMDSNQRAIQEKKQAKKKEGNGRRKQSQEEEEEAEAEEKGGGGLMTAHPHPSLNSKHLITPHNPPSSSSKLFDFNSKYIKTAIRSTISKTINKSANVSSAATPTPTPTILPQKPKPPNKLLNRLLSFS